MASEHEVSEVSSVFERLMRNGDMSLFLTIPGGFVGPRGEAQPEGVPDRETENTSTRPIDRIILVNPFTQNMVVIDATSSFGSLLREQTAKDGQPPASKASIEAMPSVEVDDDGAECAICLDNWEVGSVAKEMPCKHRFHGSCIEKWLGMHGSCPVCRYKMPVEEEEMGKKRDEEGRERSRVGREIWVSLSFSNSRSSGGSEQTPTGDSTDSSSSPRPDPNGGLENAAGI